MLTTITYSCAFFPQSHCLARTRSAMPSKRDSRLGHHAVTACESQIFDLCVGLLTNKAHTAIASSITDKLDTWQRASQRSCSSRQVIWCLGAIPHISASIKQNRAARVHMGGGPLCALNNTLGAFDLHPRGGFNSRICGMKPSQAVQHRFGSS